MNRITLLLYIYKMKYTYTILLCICCSLLFAQGKNGYLQNNRFNLNELDFKFPQNDFNIIGFGAYHGSSKTYDAEYALLNSLKSQNLLDYYIPETNYSQAFFFDQYLQNGDEELLRDLVLSYQNIVSQEGTIETFNHWKRIRKLNLDTQSKEIKVIGFDIMNEYKYPIKHILYLTESTSDWNQRNNLEQLIQNEDIDISPSNKEVKIILKNFITDYELNKRIYSQYTTDTVSLNHIIKNISYTLKDKIEREVVIFENYKELSESLDLKNKRQFAKYGFFHIQKEREKNYPSFFTRLIEQNVYPKENIISIIGYLTNSEVLWDKVYDKNGNYISYTTEKGFGIGDYWKEYFKGIKYLKKSKVSDITLFRLNNEESPYNSRADLIEVKYFMKKGNKKYLKNKSTLDFIDYAILISDSKNQIPIEEFK